jgi:hypothetical protein
VVKKGSKKYWRAIVKSMFGWKRLLDDVVRRRIAKRQAAVEDVDKALKLYDDVAKGWVMKVIKNPMVSMLRDPTLDLDFTSPHISSGERNERLMKAKVRAKGIFEGLREHLQPKEFPSPLILFLASLFRSNAYPPDSFLTEFELNRVRLDKYGAFVDLKDPHIKMLMCFYLV